ncbi:MAG: metallophosphoesterase [Pseudomonadota bacterium]
MTEPVTFLHLTDLHIADAKVPDLGTHSDTVATMQTVREIIATIDPAPAFIAISGDLTDRGDAASYRLLRELLSGFEMPLLLALGNHDSRAGFYEAYLGTPNRQGYYDHDAVVAGVHVITLDSSRPHTIGGELDETQFDWLEARLAAHSGLPKVLMLHHPLSLDGDLAAEWETLRVTDTDRLAEMIAGRGVAAILSGHIHQDRVSMIGETPLIVTQGQHTVLDALAGPEVLRMLHGASFAVCTLQAGRGAGAAAAISVNYVTLPSDRRLLGEIEMDRLRRIEAEKKAAAG